jgi:hypothetical protein
MMWCDVMCVYVCLCVYACIHWPPRVCMYTYICICVCAYVRVCV